MTNEEVVDIENMSAKEKIAYHKEQAVKLRDAVKAEREEAKKKAAELKEQLVERKEKVVFIQKACIAWKKLPAAERVESNILDEITQIIEN
jgi:hypothetical protein